MYSHLFCQYKKHRLSVGQTNNYAKFCCEYGWSGTLLVMYIHSLLWLILIMHHFNNGFLDCIAIKQKADSLRFPKTNRPCAVWQSRHELLYLLVCQSVCPWQSHKHPSISLSLWETVGIYLLQPVFQYVKLSSRMKKQKWSIILQSSRVSYVIRYTWKRCKSLCTCC